MDPFVSHRTEAACGARRGRRARARRGVAPRVVHEADVVPVAALDRQAVADPQVALFGDDPHRVTIDQQLVLETSSSSRRSGASCDEP
jgi:hypothetical protein